MKINDISLDYGFSLKSLTVTALGQLVDRNPDPQGLIQASYEACLLHETVGHVQFLRADENDFGESDGKSYLCIELQFSEHFCCVAAEIGSPLNHITWCVTLPLMVCLEEDDGPPDVFDLLSELEVLPLKNMSVKKCNTTIKAVLKHMAT